MQRARQPFKLALGVPVPVVFIRYVMVMRVGMRDRMRMRRAVVRVGERMRVNVVVIAYQRIDHDEYRSEYHDRERGKVHPRQLFLQEQKGQSRADERSHGIIRARLCRAEDVLRADVQKYGQTVGDEAQQQS